MTMTTKKQIIVMQKQLIKETGGTDGIRDEGLFEAAVFAPYQRITNENNG